MSSSSPPVGPPGDKGSATASAAAPDSPSLGSQPAKRARGASDAATDASASSASASASSSAADASAADAGASAASASAAAAADDADVCLPTPTAEELAVAARVMQFYTRSDAAVKELQATSTPSARSLRKSAMAYMQAFEATQGQHSAAVAQRRAQQVDAQIRESRKSSFKAMDKQRLAKVQLRVMRQDALSKLIEPQPIVDFVADGLLTNAGEATPTLTHAPTDEPNANGDASAAATNADGKSKGTVVSDVGELTGCKIESRSKTQKKKMGMESADEQTSGVEPIPPAHSIGQTGTGYRASESTTVPTFSATPQLTHAGAGAASAKKDSGATVGDDDEESSASARASVNVNTNNATANAKSNNGRNKRDKEIERTMPASIAAALANANIRKNLPKVDDLLEAKSYLDDDALKGDADEADFTLLNKPQACYVCKRNFVFLHSHYDKLCPPCARVNWAKRNQVADLRGYTAVLTGARVKIGFECGLKLLRCGARVIATSRFPHDTAKRYAELEDFPVWKDNLHVHGLDMRDLKAVIAFTELVKTLYGRVDIIVNNAAQTVRRPPLYYRHLLEDELKPRDTLPEHLRDVVKEDAHSFYAGFKMAAQRQAVAAITNSSNSKSSSGASASAAGEAMTDDSASPSSATVEDVTDHGHSHSAARASASAVPAVDAVTEAIAAAVTGTSTTGTTGAAGATPVVEEVSEFGTAATIDASVLESVTDAMLSDGQTLPPLAMAARRAAEAEVAATVASAGASSGAVTVSTTGSSSSATANQQLTESLKTTDNKAALLSQLRVVDGQDSDGAEMAKFFPVGIVDVTGQQVDLRPVNSWILTMSAVEPGELVETFAVNALAPFIINSRLLPVMQEANPSKPRFVINVSAMEGKFYRHKGPQHPHTNMAKAALNMMTRTSAQECVQHQIYMNSVDTGWINDENPYEIAKRTAEATQFHTPIDETDAMARILDPIIDAVNTGKAVWGKFLKDFRSTEW